MDTTKVRRANLWTAGAYWHELIPFKGNNFAGYPVDHSNFPYSTGMMPEHEHELYRKGTSSYPKPAANPIIYVVFSYSTPVAWVYADGRRYVTDTKYSVTTSKQISCAGLRVPLTELAYWAWRTSGVYPYAEPEAAPA